MFSSHGTEEEELEAYTYAEDEERRRQFRENMLEGLKVGEEDGYGGEDSLPDNGLPAAQNGGADRKENVNSAALPSTERLPTFHPRKNQALRNTFGFIAPGDIPTADDPGAPAAPTKLRVSLEQTTAPKPTFPGARQPVSVENGNAQEPTPVSPLVPRASPSVPGRSPISSPSSPSPLRAGQQPQPVVTARTMRPGPAPSPSSPLGRPAVVAPLPSPSALRPAAVSPSSSPALPPSSSPSPSSPASIPAPVASPASIASPAPPGADSNSVTARRPLPGGPSASPGRPLPGPGRAPIPASQRPPPPLTLPAGLSPPSLPPMDPGVSSSSPSMSSASSPSSSSAPSATHATLGGSGTLAFARPAPPNGVAGGRSSPSVPQRAGLPPPVASRAPVGSSPPSSSASIHATMRAPPPSPPPRNGSPAIAGTPPASASVAASILSPRLGPSLTSSGSTSTVPPARESDDFMETVSKKEIVSVHCSIEKRDKYVVGGDVAIKLRIINDSAKVIRHINVALAKSTAAERQKDDKRREKNKSLPKFEGSDEMVSFSSSRFPLEKGLFDGTLTYKVPPCSEGSYSNFKVELVVELALKKSIIYAFLPINL